MECFELFGGGKVMISDFFFDRFIDFLILWLEIACGGFHALLSSRNINCNLLSSLDLIDAAFLSSTYSF